MEFVLIYIRWIKGLSSRSSKIGPVKSYFRNYEYQINYIIFEEDDLPSLQIHTKHFL